MEGGAVRADAVAIRIVGLRVFQRVFYSCHSLFFALSLSRSHSNSSEQRRDQIENSSNETSTTALLLLLLYLAAPGLAARVAPDELVAVTVLLDLAPAEVVATTSTAASTAAPSPSTSTTKAHITSATETRVTSSSSSAAAAAAAATLDVLKREQLNAAFAAVPVVERSILVASAAGDGGVYVGRTPVTDPIKTFGVNARV